MAADREKGPHLRGAKRPVWKRERTRCDALEAPGDGNVTRNSAPAVGAAPAVCDVVPDLKEAKK